MASQVECIKWVPGTDFLVDGFAFKSPRCSHYFLTHFHSDHTVGLNKSFDGGVIYCSHVTARLLVHDMGIKPARVKPLAVGTAVVIAGVRVTPLDANHCPGAVMFLFQVPAAAAAAAGAAAAAAATKARRLPANGAPAALPDSPDCGSPAAPSTPTPAPCAGASHGASLAGPHAASQKVEAEDGREEAGRAWTPGAAGSDAAGSAAGGVEPSGGPADASADAPGCGAAEAATYNILHTGDCRWQRWMRDQPGLAGVRVDTLLLDTTYAAPKHTLPPQQEAVALMVQVMRDALAAEPQTVFVVAAYHIGKERAFLGAAQQLGARVWCSPAKRAVLRLLDLPAELLALLVDDPRDAAVHVTGWGLRPEDLQAHLERHPSVWRQAVGIRPTGWTLRRSGGVSIRREGNVAVVGVPYSEHSSWTDLCDAVAQLRPRTLIPTVNAYTPTQRRALVDRFAHLMDLSADRSRLDVYFSRGALAGRVDRHAGCEATSSAPGSGACAAARDAAAATAASVAAAVTVVRVDLAAVDLGEQERIMADLQQRRERQQRQQQQRQRRRGKRMAPGGEEEAAAGAAAAKRPRTSASQQQVPVAEGRADAAKAAPVPGSACCWQLRTSLQAPASDAAGRNAGGRPASSDSSVRSDSGGGGAACVIDLSFDDDGDCDDGSDEDGDDGKDRTQMEAPAGAGVASKEERPRLGSCTTTQRPAREYQAAAGKERRSAGMREGVSRGAPDGQQTPPAAAAPPVSPALQSSIRRFFAPVSIRVAAAILGGQERGVCVQEA